MRSALQMIEQASRGRDQNFDAGVQSAGLRRDIDTAIDDGGAQRQIFAVGAHAFFNLCGKLARRGENERAHRVTRG
jgi:hypothetical protein